MGTSRPASKGRRSLMTRVGVGAAVATWMVLLAGPALGQESTIPAAGTTRDGTTRVGQTYAGMTRAGTTLAGTTTAGTTTAGTTTKGSIGVVNAIPAVR
jgi:hypothetical protein